MQFQENFKYSCDSHFVSTKQSCFRAVFLSRRYLTVSEHNFECRGGDVAGICWIEARDATVLRTACTTKWSGPKCQQRPNWEMLQPRIFLSAVDKTGFLLRPIFLMVKHSYRIVIFLVGIYGRKGRLPFALSQDQKTFSPTEESKFQGFISEINE